MMSRVFLSLLLLHMWGTYPIYASNSRYLTSRPLHDVASAPHVHHGHSGTTTQTGVVHIRSNTRQGPGSAIHEPPQPRPPPWELDLAPFVSDLLPQRDPNMTLLRGPPHLEGSYRGLWLKAQHGSFLQPRDLVSEDRDRGMVVLHLEGRGEAEAGDGGAGKATAGRDSGAGTRWSAGPLPGGVQDIRGELILRDGPRVTAKDLRFRLRGTYVPASGTVHAILEPLLPIREDVLARQQPNGTNGTAGTNETGSANGGSGGPMTAGAAAGVTGAAVAAARVWRDGGGEAGLAGSSPDDSAAAFAGSPGGAGSGGAAGDGAGTAGRGAGESVAARGYREALRAGARRLIALGPRWSWALVRGGPPPPPMWVQIHNRREALAAAAAARAAGRPEPPSPSPPPPQPPLELALYKTCEFRAHFRVYYKGDPEAPQHVNFLGLDQPAPPPPAPPPRAKRHTVVSEAAGDRSGSQSGTPAPPPPPPPAAAVAAAESAAAAATGDVLVSAAASAAGGSSGGGDVSRHHHRRRLAADTEIYHSTQMQLHRGTDDPWVSALSAADGVGASNDNQVYGIPPGMDPHDPDLELIGLVLSPNCEFAVHFNGSSVHLERYFRQAARYSALVAVVTISQIVLSLTQSEAAASPSAAARMSLYSVTLQAIMDAYQCLLHLTGALVVEALFGAFASVAFLQFLLFAVFEMKQTLLVWRAQRTNGTGTGGDMWSVRRDMSAVYTRFYALLLIGLLLMFQLQSQLALLLVALHSWWLPQVVHSAMTDTRPPLRMDYIWGMSALRLVSPLYFYGCPRNLLRVEYRPEVCVVLVCWVGLQAALLTLQVKRGPRVFIPRAFLPRRYDYHRPATKREMGLGEETYGSHTLRAAAAAMAASASPEGGRNALRHLAGWLTTWVRRQPPPPSVAAAAATPAAAAAAARRDNSGGAAAAASTAAAGSRGSGGGGVDVETGHGSKECVICMNPVPLLPLTARMVTPCGHFFHEPCLTRWMGVKMDCPTCRRPLPPA